MFQTRSMVLVDGHAATAARAAPKVAHGRLEGRRFALLAPASGYEVDRLKDDRSSLAYRILRHPLITRMAQRDECRRISVADLCACVHRCDGFSARTASGGGRHNTDAGSNKSEARRGATFAGAERNARPRGAGAGRPVLVRHRDGKGQRLVQTAFAGRTVSDRTGSGGRDQPGCHHAGAAIVGRSYCGRATRC